MDALDLDVVRLARVQDVVDERLVLGLAFGIGLNAKYAMAWFLLCLSVMLVMLPANIMPASGIM